MNRQAVLETIDYAKPWLPVKVWEIIEQPPGPGVNPWKSWHYHEEVEFLAVLEGAMQVETIDGRYALEQGSVLVLGSSEPHRAYKSVYVRYIVLQVNLRSMLEPVPGMYSPILSEHPHPLSHYNATYSREPACRESFRLIRTILQEAAGSRHGYELAVTGHTRLLLLELVRGNRPDSRYDLHRMRHVLDHIEAHLAERIEIHDVLPMVNLSYHHFIKSFKQCVGLSFTAYVHHRRVKKAEKLLLTADWNNEQIGFACGFATPAQFYNIFKRVNRCSPKAFRSRKIQEN